MKTRPLSVRARKRFIQQRLPRQKTAVSRTPRMLNFNIAMVGMFFSGLLGMWLIFVLFLALEGIDTYWWGWPVKPLTSEQSSGIARSVGTIAALFGGLFAILYSYRKQRISEAESFREDEKVLASRYQAAAEQIGDENAAVRLAGIYSMAQLAMDWPERRQECVDVLTAYARLALKAELSEHEEIVIVQAIFALIGQHCGSKSEDCFSWSPLRIDLSNCHIPAFKWSNVYFENLDFSGSSFYEDFGIYGKVAPKGIRLDNAEISARGRFILQGDGGDVDAFHVSVQRGGELWFTNAGGVGLTAFGAFIEKGGEIRVDIGQRGRRRQFDFTDTTTKGILRFSGEGDDCQDGTVILEGSRSDGGGLAAFQRQIIFEPEDGMEEIVVSDESGFRTVQTPKVGRSKRRVVRPAFEHLPNLRVGQFWVGEPEVVPDWTGDGGISE